MSQMPMGQEGVWEYQVMPLDVEGWVNRTTDPASLNQAFNEVGARGWELVTVIDIANGGTTTQLLALFKRRAH